MLHSLPDVSALNGTLRFNYAGCKMLIEVDVNRNTLIALQFALIALSAIRAPDSMLLSCCYIN